MSDRIRVFYDLYSDAEAPEIVAEAIAREQTVELPLGSYPDRIQHEIVGQVERVESLGDAHHRYVISYDPMIVGKDILQLVNVLFGNVSLMDGVRVSDIELPESLTKSLGGPHWGIPGLRELSGVSDRPILVGAIKPVGLRTTELADRGAALARGGLDIVKDDHGIADQQMAPFRDRVERCSAAIADAAARVGRQTLYAPNVTGPLDGLSERVAFAMECGCRLVVIAPMLMGLDAARVASAAGGVGGGVAILAHPTMTGALFAPRRGLAPEVLYGTLFRLAGCDGVIFTAAGGRFPLDSDTTIAIAEKARSAVPGVPPSLPIAGGGVSTSGVREWIGKLGRDVGFLVGSDLYASGDLEAAARRLVETVETAGS